MSGYIEGPIGSGKTSRLLAEAERLLDGLPASSILVLCSNNTRKTRFTQNLLKRRSTPIAQMPVYTYAGFVRNALFNYWPLVEAQLAAAPRQRAEKSATLSRAEKSVIQPELSGMEDSELILRWQLHLLREEWGAKDIVPYRDFPGTDKHILKQIVRRLRQRSENQLTREDMRQRSEQLGEMCLHETHLLERQFDSISYKLRVLDANKQLDVFHSLLSRENALSRDLRRDLKHLLVDDVDETIHAQQQFIQWLAPSVDTLILAADVDGGSRRGYLNAYPYDWEALKILRPGDKMVLTREDDCYKAGQTLLANWLDKEAFVPLPSVVKSVPATMTRVAMLDQVVEDILASLESGAQPGDFCLILPKTDVLSIHHLTRQLSRHGLPVQLLSGTSRPSDNPKCRAFLSLLHWVNCRQFGVTPSAWEIKGVLVHVFAAHHWPGMTEENLDALVQAIHAQTIRFCQQKGPPHPLPQGGEWTDPLSPASNISIRSLIPSVEELGHVLSIRLEGQALLDYQQLSAWLAKAATLPFDQQLYSAFSDLMARFATEKTAYGDLNRIIQSYIRQRDIFDGLLVQQVARTGDASAPMQDFPRWWLAQVKTGSVADAPDVPEEIREDALIITTPQKAIDSEVYRKIQCWLDISCREWSRSDNAPLYNAWVHSAVWDGSNTAFSEEFNEAVIRTRAGHITRTLMLLATEQIRAYSSELDDFGAEQGSLLVPRLLAETIVQDAPLERAVLRPDQAPILEYRRGTMAISAVPGAGKTFVNVELLLELIEAGVEPDSILVLTYMDSAAKTLLSRLKKKLAGVTTKLPAVSTIHSLALRILMENDQSLLVNAMPDDMTILDDFGRNEILLGIANATLPESYRNPNDWQRAIDRGVTHAKMLGLTQEMVRQSHQPTFRLLEFLPAWQAYDNALHNTGSLDFTDLILKAVQILCEHDDIRAKYQKRYQYIIEDEAQDSSKTLQAFIQLLGGETPNLIRTGDTNQSITTTFSSADTSVFRNFVRDADRLVQMDRSGRCALDIIDLANRWMVLAGSQPGLEHAFQPVAMLPVEGRNPHLLEAPQAQLFETERDEDVWMTERIARLRHDHPEASVAVLVRNNGQVNKITAMLQAAGIKAVGLSDSINQHPIFKRILGALKLLAEPADLTNQAEWAEAMADIGLLPDNAQRPARLAFLSEAPLLYASPASLQDEWLRQWHYDLLDYSRQANGGNLGSLIAKMADALCHESEDRSNGYLCALMAAEILHESRAGSDETLDLMPVSSLEIVIRKFEAYQRTWRGRKGFGELLSRQGHQVVQVMTLHKSKGQEFEAVFIPYLQADAFPHSTSAIRFDEADKLIRDLDKVAAGAKEGSSQSAIDFGEGYIEAKKREKIEEEARLMYVGLSRARQALYLTAHRQGVRYGKLRPSEPALVFRLLSEYLSGKAMERELPGLTPHPSPPPQGGRGQENPYGFEVEEASEPGAFPDREVKEAEPNELVMDEGNSYDG